MIKSIPHEQVVITRINATCPACGGPHVRTNPTDRSTRKDYLRGQLDMHCYKCNNEFKLVFDIVGVEVNLNEYKLMNLISNP